ncbi:MAG: N5-carboxyaminoimidazole ribonucleotide mutase [Candidatus Dichloromethanomonas elyunquensis]|nr:MAG: N5-carboxyaminoimidazole ribonucleotide mutase [Candidatus Dichloromethanomonas elyunquensis]
MSSVGVMMGSDSDWNVMEEAIKTLKQFGVSYEVKVSSAHRTLKRTVEWVENFETAGGKIIIAGAGLAAHLPGVIAGASALPVIGVPIRNGALEGVDALYAIVQMPPGIPVAAVGINGARNAALLAVEMLSMEDKGLRDALKAYRQKMAEEVDAKDKALLEKLNS